MVERRKTRLRYPLEAKGTLKKFTSSHKVLVLIQLSPSPFRIWSNKCKAKLIWKGKKTGKSNFAVRVFSAFSK